MTPPRTPATVERAIDEALGALPMGSEVISMVAIEDRVDDPSLSLGAMHRWISLAMRRRGAEPWTRRNGGRVSSYRLPPEMQRGTSA